MYKNQYDTDVCCWSPAGRLFQGEYAAEAVKCVGSALVFFVFVFVALNPSDVRVCMRAVVCLRVQARQCRGRCHVQDPHCVGVAEAVAV